MKLNRDNFWYKDWLDKTYGLMPHKTEHPNSFNNVVFSADLLLGLKAADNLSQMDVDAFREHIHINLDKHGLYKPKNSKDNILGKISGIFLTKSFDEFEDMDVEEACEGKHFLDQILTRFWLDRKLMHFLLMPIAFGAMIWSILSPGKVRPKWYERQHFTFRLKAFLGIIQPIKEETVGSAHFKTYENNQRIAYIQNDGKKLNLHRLYLLKHEPLLKPFVTLCKKLYILRLGKDFQYKVMANYYNEKDHPVNVVFRRLDKENICILD